MYLAFLCVFGVAPKAFAQGGPGSWQVVMEGSGVKNTPYGPAPVTVQNPLNDSGVGGISASITVKLKWTGSGSPTAPPKSVKISSTAGGVAYGPGGSVGANNGFLDRVNSSGGGPPNYNITSGAVGKHIVRVPAAPGNEIVVGTYSVSATSTSGGVWISFATVADPRDVFISSNIEPNYHRSSDPPGQGRPIQTIRLPNGDMVVDCQGPTWWLQALLPITITYDGNAFGWSFNSYYEWRSSLGSFSADGTPQGGYFNPWPLQSDTGYYRKGYVTSGTTDAITLAVTDGNDGAKGEGHYTVRFHDTFDEPKAVTAQDSRPRTWAQFPEDWQNAGYYENPSDVPITATITVKFTQQSGWKLTLGAETKVPPILASVFTKATVGGGNEFRNNPRILRGRCRSSSKKN